MQAPGTRAIHYRYVLMQVGERYEFRPSPQMVAWMASGLAFGTLLFVGAAVYTFISFDSLGMIVGTFCLLLAAMLAVGVVWALRSRRTALIVEPGGAVHYGARELCPAGSVHSVRLADARGGESGDCEVCLEVDDGKLVYMPSTAIYFGLYKRRSDARPFAQELAAALGVALTESC